MAVYLFSTLLFIRQWFLLKNPPRENNSLVDETLPRSNNRLALEVENHARNQLWTLMIDIIFSLLLAELLDGILI
jgi:hypothetical protein